MQSSFQIGDLVQLIGTSWGAFTDNVVVIGAVKKNKLHRTYEYQFISGPVHIYMPGKFWYIGDNWKIYLINKGNKNGI